MKQKMFYLVSFVRYLSAMFVLQPTNRIRIIRFFFCILIPFLILGYSRSVSSLPSLETFSLNQYYERADVYRDYMAALFVWLTPCALAMTGLILTFKRPVQLTESVIAFWNQLPAWFFYGVFPAIFSLLSAWTAWAVIGAVPRVFDAFNYYLQARNFALGQFCALEPPLPDVFRFPFIVIENGRWYGSVYPGYSLLLAIGVRLGVDWLTSPVLGGISLMMLYFAAREMIGENKARVVVLLGLLSPFYRMMSSIFMAHIAGVLWITLAIWMLWRWAEKAETVSWRTPFAAGIAIGGIYITRPQAALVTLPFFILNTAWKARKSGWTRWLVFATPLIASIVFLAVYNHQLTGDYRVNPRYYVDPERRLGFGDDLGEPLADGVRGGHDVWRGLHNTALLLSLWNAEMFGTGASGQFGWLTPVILFLVAVAYRNKLVWFLVSAILFNACLYVLYFTPSPNFGPRYFAEVIPASLIAFVWGIDEINHRISRSIKHLSKTNGLVILLIIMMGVQVLVMLPVYTTHYGILPPVTRRNRSIEPERPSVILVEPDVYTMNIYTWNSPNLNGNIFLPLKSVVSLQAVQKAFPERDMYRMSQAEDYTGYVITPINIVRAVE